MTFTDIWTLRPQPAAGAVISGDGYRVTVLTERLFRLEYAPGNRFRDGATAMAINREFPLPEFEVRRGADRLSVETACVRLEYDMKPFSPTGLTAVLKDALLNHGSVWHYGESRYNLKGTARTLDRADGATVIPRAPGEMGVPLDLGEGLMSLDGFAALDDSRSMGMDDQGNLTPADGAGIDLYLFAYGHDFKSALRDFYHLSGPVPAVPRYALGNWWSRYYCYTEQSYKALVERFAAERVPLSVAVIDMNWHVTDIDPRYGTGWTGYTWNPEMFPDPAAMLKWLHDRHLKVTLNDHPADGVRACEDLYPEMAREMGIDPASGIPVDFDAGSDRLMKAWERVVLDSFERTGVDFWWIDWQQRGGSSVPGVDPLFVLNHTRWLYANRRGDVGMTFSRYGGPGSHRYPVGFSGDTCITWDSLAFQPYFTATAANIGYGWWSHDIGGHMLGIRDEELAVRWLQFGVFSPIMRLHSSMSEFLRKEPWSYSMEPCAVMEDFMRLRHRLVPWLYTQALNAARDGGAILYPVYYDYNPGWALLEIQHHEYIFGGDMLVAPIVRPANPDTRLGCADVWLPEGEWVDFFTGWRYVGGQRMKVFRPLSGMPVFVRPGTIVPMDAATAPENGCPLPEALCFKVFVGQDGDYTLIEDDGSHPGSGRCRRVETRCTVECGDGLSVHIWPAEGAADLLPANRRTLIELVGVGNVPPDAASCEYQSRYDPETRALTLALSASPAEGAALRWHRAPAPPAPDIPALLYRLLLPIRMENVVKDAMLDIANTVPRPEHRLAAWMRFDLPEGLAEALAELEGLR
ncbi:MAG: hypothetical protein IJH86_05340 [Clostridia bacterium]|nr:hypothetical protein [Clostridia bacterium]